MSDMSISRNEKIVENGILQGTKEWLEVRRGKLTASRVADMLAKTRTGWGASRDNYAAELVAERLTGTPYQQYTNAAMEWGTEKEPEARSIYELMTGYSVNQIGFVSHPSIEMAGCSPDGLVGDDGLVEIKCPSSKTHIETLLAEAVPVKYVLQMQFQMACTGRKWCDFVSFDPRMPGDMQMFVTRLTRDDQAISYIEAEARVFLAEVDDVIERLTATYRIQDAAE